MENDVCTLTHLSRNHSVLLDTIHGTSPNAIRDADLIYTSFPKVHSKT